MKDYYKKIGYDEYSNLLWDNSISIKSSRINKLEILLPTFDILTTSFHGIKGENIIYVKILVNKFEVPIELIELVDEWFIVYLPSYGSISQYKCDQFDGVIKLLEDEKIIK